MKWDVMLFDWTCEDVKRKALSSFMVVVSVIGAPIVVCHRQAICLGRS